MITHSAEGNTTSAHHLWERDGVHSIAVVHMKTTRLKHTLVSVIVRTLVRRRRRRRRRVSEYTATPAFPWLVCDVSICLLLLPLPQLFECPPPNAGHCSLNVRYADTHTSESLPPPPPFPSCQTLPATPSQPPHNPLCRTALRCLRSVWQCSGTRRLCARGGAVELIFVDLGTGQFTFRHHTFGGGGAAQTPAPRPDRNSPVRTVRTTVCRLWGLASV